jgi:hypothetical protein
MRTRVLFLLAAISLPLPLLADTTYTYTGNDFINYHTSPFTASDSISGWFTLSSPLADNLSSLTYITPVSFSFTDGVDTITNQTHHIGYSFGFVTNASGAITQWNIGISDQLGNQIAPVNETGYSMDLAYTFFALGGYENGNPGTWSEENSSSVTPEPSALVLFATGLMGLASAVRFKLLHS